MKRKLSALFQCLWPSFLFVFIQIAVMTAFQVLSSSPGGSVLDDPDTRVIAMAVSSVITLIFISFVAYRRGYLKRGKAAFRSPSALTAICLAAVGFFLFCSSVLLFLKDTPLVRSYIESSSVLTSADIVLRIAVLSFLAPLCEEMVFRVLTENELLKRTGAFAAVFLQAILFGLAHFSPVQSTYALFAGLILGYIYLKTESLGCSLAFHFTFNITNLIIELPALSFLSDMPAVMMIAGLAFFIPSAFYFIKKTLR